jgi:hypothetical protein
MKHKIIVFLLSSLLLILVYSIFIFSSIKYLQANPLAFTVYFTLMVFMLLIFIALLEIETDTCEATEMFLFVNRYR